MGVRSTFRRHRQKRGEQSVARRSRIPFQDLQIENRDAVEHGHKQQFRKRRYRLAADLRVT